MVIGLYTRPHLKIGLILCSVVTVLIGRVLGTGYCLNNTLKVKKLAASALLFYEQAEYKSSFEND